jgi:hypothetical protein
VTASSPISERLVTRGPQRLPEQPGGCQQRRDLGVGVDIGRDPRPVPGQQVGGGDLAGGVDRREVAREPASDSEALAPAVRVRVHRQPRPLQCQLGGDPLSARLLE